MSDETIGPVIRDDLFERLNLPHPAEYRARVDLAFLIVKECDRRRLKKSEAAGLLDLTWGEYSRLANGRVEGFSRGRLEKLLTRLAIDVRG